MPLSSGDQLGHYKIVSMIGKGGMGEVYRATDTKLDRDVAIKVLPAAFASDSGRLTRFEREAKVLASLNHSGIASIYGVEDHALVMELVPGPTLEDRIKQGPIPADEALDILLQIAEAFEYAHDKGIIHRDLKPANIKIDPEDKVKILDFGLAKAFADPLAGVSDDPTNSPTVTMGGTMTGTILGTAAYMAPEQARGKKVDKRADIWAFGVVVWEMLTGERLFKGETTVEVLGKVLEQKPDLDSVPETFRRLLARCLDRNVKDRLRDIGEARFLLESPKEVPTEASPPTVVEAPAPRSKLPWVIAAAAIFVVTVLGVTLWSSWRAAPEPRVLKMSVLPPEKMALQYSGVPAVSPDGRLLAFAGALDGKTGLWVRDLGSLEARFLPGTDGASLPFWSPDSRYLGFFTNGKLKKTGAAGGPALTLCDAPNGRGGTWNQNDVIVFAPAVSSGLSRVPAAGGTPVPVTTLNEQEPGHRFPWFLPDGRHFLYTAYQGQEKDTLYVADLESKSRSAVMPAASNVVYASPGYLLFLRDLTLMAQPFDAAKLRTTGDAVPIAEQVGYSALDIRAWFSSSQNGVLAYSSRGTVESAQLVWLDRSGKMAGTVGAPGAPAWPSISPDGNSVAVGRRDPQTGLSEIWLYDRARGTEARFTFDSQSNRYPAWSPDQGHIAFASSTGGATALHRRATSGVGQDEILDRGFPIDWSRDGRYIVDGHNDARTGYDIWVLPLFEDEKPFPYLQTTANEHWAKLSPNGKWLAYESDESKRNEIYVQTFPQPGGKSQISTNGGEYPVWSRDGKELFYIGAGGKMMAVEVKSGPKFEASVPKPLFDIRYAGFGFDVGKDGRFLIPAQVEQAAGAPITVVVNWTVALKK